MIVGGFISFIEDNPVFAAERPYVHVSSTEALVSRSNCTFNAQTPSILTDYRDRDDKENLNTNGFAFIHWPLEYPRLEEAVRSTTPSSTLLLYLDSARLIVENFLQASSTIVFDWRFRKAGSVGNENSFHEGSAERNDFVLPAYKAHSDLSPIGGWDTLRAYLHDSEFEMIQKGKTRAKIIGFWQPLVSKVIDYPLAFCKKGTVSASDIVVYDRVDEANESEGTFLKYNQGQEWCWLSDQSWDEVSVFQHWDSEMPEHNDQTFHAALFDPKASDPTAQSRKSVELRIIALFHK